MTLLLPHEVDELFRYRRGRAAQLARRGKIPHVILPDGEIRFNEAEILLIAKPKQPTNTPTPEVQRGR